MSKFYVLSHPNSGFVVYILSLKDATSIAYLWSILNICLPGSTHLFEDESTVKLYRIMIFLKTICRNQKVMKQTSWKYVSFANFYILWFQLFSAQLFLLTIMCIFSMRLMWSGLWQFFPVFPLKFMLCVLIE